MVEGSTQQRIQQRLNRMRRLFAHLVLTLLIVLGIIYSVDHLGIPPQTEDDLIPIVVLLFIAHALWVGYQEAGQFITQQETQRGDSYDELDEKPKHHLGVGDDGELTEVISDEDVWDEKVKHSQ
jgi:hypothetical protein